MELKYHYEYLSNLEKRLNIKLNSIEKTVICSIIENKNAEEVVLSLYKSKYNTIQGAITSLVNKEIIIQKVDKQLELTQPFIELDYIIINFNLIDIINKKFNYQINNHELLVLSTLNEFKYLTIEQIQTIINICYGTLQGIISKLEKKSIIKIRQTLLLKDLYYLSEDVILNTNNINGEYIEDLETRNSNLTTTCTKLTVENIDLRNKVLENSNIILKLNQEIKKIKENNENVRQNIERDLKLL